MKKYYLLSTTEGCATNLLENAGHREHYNAQGYAAAASSDDADVILINTCAYNKAMEDRTTGMIAEYQKKYPGKEIVVAGCFPKINPKKAKSFSDVTILDQNPRTTSFAQFHKFNKEDFERLSKKHKFVLKMRPLYFAIEKLFKMEFRPLHNIVKSVIVNEDFFLITVSTGCVGKCTFCAIKRAKGSLKSRPLPTILSEFETGLKAGYKNFWLLGDDIGCWGQDIGMNITDLVNGFLSREGQFEIVLNYLDPQFMQKYPEGVVQVLSDPRIVGINLPIQSASAPVLAAMERYYDPATIEKLMAEVKQKNPALAIKTNIIVGFPGETWGDFLKSVRSVFSFDAVLAMRFAAKAHTPAANFPNQVPEILKLARMAIMNTAILARHGWVVLKSLFDSRPQEPLHSLDRVHQH